MNVNWTQVPIKNDFDPEARKEPQFVALSDNRRLVINGGTQFGLSSINNRSIVFDAQDNTWQKLPNFTGENDARYLFGHKLRFLIFNGLLDPKELR